MGRTALRTPLDCLIVGAGPAGLAAATYLARFRRNVLVVHSGESRAAWIPLVRNCPGFPDGIEGEELLRRLEDQVRRHGAEIRLSPVTGIGTASGGGFDIGTTEGPVWARSVLLATGVADRLPALPDLRGLVRSGHVRVCPVCDGFEVIGKTVAVLGSGPHALKEAKFLQTFTPDVFVIADRPGAFDETMRGDAAAAGVVLREAPHELSPVAAGWRATPAAGEDFAFDTLYPALGCDVRSAFPGGLSLARDPQGQIRTDAHQRSSVAGVYAAGDVVHALNQIAVAFGQAAIAATAIHNDLKQDDTA